MNFDPITLAMANSFAAAKINTKATGYSEIKEYYVFPETAVTFESSEDGSFGCALTLIDEGLYKASRCKVVFDGVEHICEKKQFNGVEVYGNLSIIEPGADNTGEPFFLAAPDSSDPYYSAIISNTGGSHILAISVTGEVINKIDEKLIPGAVVKILDPSDYGIEFGPSASAVYKDTGAFWEAVDKCDHFIFYFRGTYNYYSMINYGSNGTGKTTWITVLYPGITGGDISKLYIWLYNLIRVDNADGSTDTKVNYISKIFT